MKVLTISGSLRSGSYSRQLLRAARELAEGDIEFEAYDGLGELPIYDEDIDTDEAPGPVAELRDAISGADAVLIATPEYNASIPGGLKNAIDWASRPHGLAALVGKPVAVISSSPSPFGGTWAGEHLRRSLTIAGAMVAEREVAVGKVAEKLVGGHLADGEAAAEITALVTELAEMAESARASETAIAA